MNELPPLPEPDVPLPDDWAIRENWADQMKAYALSAVQAERDFLAHSWVVANGFDKHGVAAFIKSRSQV